MNTKNNQRTRLTRMLFQKAYLELLEEYANDRITVRALCEKAELNRSTFYLHYQEPNDVLKEIEDQQMMRCSEYLDKISINPDGNSYEQAQTYTKQLLSFIRENARTYTILLLHNRDLHFRRKFQEATFVKIMESFDIPEGLPHAQMAYHYLVAGCMTILEDWIAGGLRESEESMMVLFFALARGGLSGLLEAKLQ